MEKHFFTKIFLLFYLMSFAQVQENMIMERFNMNAFNPAYTGSEGREISFTTRSPWKGVSQAPKINYFYYSGNPKKNLSIGASVISNKIFIDTRTQYSLDASYQLSIDEESNLFLGVKIGANTKNTNLEGLSRITTEANPAIATQNNATYPIFGLGALFKTEKFYLSASIPNFLNPKIFVDKEAFVGSEKPNTYFLAGTSINTNLYDFKIKPFISAKLIPDGQNQTHFGTTLDYKDIIEIGGGFKNTGYNNLLILIKTKFGFIFAYAYDFGTPSGESALIKSGSELFIKFRF